MTAPAPAADLSVVLVAPRRFAGIRRTVRHLRRQTIRDRLELVIVAASEDAIDDRGPAELDGFRAVETLAVGPIENVDRALAPGIRAASAPVVALLEDHAFPAPDWAETLVRAHASDDWAAVGSTMVNANPAHSTSWVSMIIAYGRWLEPARAGEIDTVARHNSSFKRSVLVEEFGDQLEERLGRDRDLLADLASRGHRFYLAADTHVAHVNPSRFASMARLRFHAGRLYGARRAQREGWSVARRWLHLAGGPLIPWLLLWRLHRQHASDRPRLLRRVLPALLAGLAIQSLGEVTGCLAGAGRAPEVLAAFEMDRRQHLTAADRARLDDGAVDVGA